MVTGYLPVYPEESQEDDQHRDAHTDYQNIVRLYKIQCCVETHDIKTENAIICNIHLSINDSGREPTRGQQLSLSNEKKC